ncbi:MAG: cyclic nucleotide-binding domain-containing protein [Acidobacteria bacterium]|nr:cyclic nucleotide-binding domain-containing protein [Acidobacteriota bacterium]
MKNDFQISARQMSVIEKVLLLQDVDLFSQVSPEQLARIALLAEELHVGRGKVLLRENEISDAMYIIASGKVALESGSECLSVAGEKEAIGTWALLDNEPMLATATVMEDARVLRIERDDFYDLLSDHADITQSMFRALIRRIRTLVDK